MSARQSFGRQACEICGNIFTKRDHLERHVRTHTREKPFSCSRCGASFSRRDTLRRHMRACHVTESHTATDIQARNAPIQPGLSSAGVPFDDGDSVDLGMSIPSPDSIAAATSTAFETGRDQPLNRFADNLPGSVSIESDLVNLDWQWADNFNLEASFRMEDVGTSDLNSVNPAMPWLPSHASASDGAITYLSDPNLDSAYVQDINHPSPTTSNFAVRTRHSQVPPIGRNVASTEGDISRDVLSASLNRRVPETPIPTTAFLNRCIKVFMTRLWHLVPIIHLPSFRSSSANPLLVLSICSLGALADGSDGALYYANELFESVRKTILVSCSTFTALGDDILQVLQAAVLGQTFAILSAQRSQLLIAQAFHGTLSVAANAFLEDQSSKGRMPEELHTDIPSAEDWHYWVQDQSIMRLMSVIHVHDGELAAMLNHPGMMAKHPNQASRAAPDELFLAKTAEEWVNLSRIARADTRSVDQLDYGHRWQRSPIAGCAILSAYLAEIGRLKSSPLQNMNDQFVMQVTTFLTEWAEDFAQSLSSDGWQRLSVEMLWYSCFMFMLCDVHAIGKLSRQTEPLTNDQLRSLRLWSSRVQARRCASHALMVMRLTERLKASEPPAIHVARAAYHAGLVMAIYSLPQTSIARNSNSEGHCCTSNEPLAVELSLAHTLRLINSNDLTMIGPAISRSKCRTYAFALCATLRHLGPWPNAKVYANRLDRVLQLIELTE